MWQIWLVYNGFTRGSIVSCHGMVRGDDEGYSNRRYKRNSYAVKAQTGRRYFYFFLLSFFLLILLAFCLRSRLFFFLFFRLILVAWSRPTRFFFLHVITLFFLSFFFETRNESRKSFAFYSPSFSLFARILLLRLVAQSSDQIMGYSTGFP